MTRRNRRWLAVIAAGVLLLGLGAAFLWVLHAPSVRRANSGLIGTWKVVYREQAQPDRDYAWELGPDGTLVIRESNRMTGALLRREDGYRWDVRDGQLRLGIPPDFRSFWLGRREYVYALNLRADEKAELTMLRNPTTRNLGHTDWDLALYRVEPGVGAGDFRPGR